MNTPIASRILCLACALLALSAAASSAQTFTNIAYFDVTNGTGALSSLTQGTDGNFYGTAAAGGANGYGTVFKVTPTGTLTALHSFCSQANCADGYGATSPLSLGTDGNFYGTTFAGGDEGSCFPPNGCGTVFRITPEGVFSTLHAFTGADGEQPLAGLALGIDGNFYGTTEGGGTGSCFCGTVFRMTPAGVLTTLYSFDGDGTFPSAALVQGTDGNLYGTAYEGGSNACLGGCGTVFKITTGGVFTSLHDFELTDGERPLGQLFQASNGAFYGTTWEGGAIAGGYGTIFRISASGSFATVHRFHSNDGGAGNSQSGLVQATDGNFYGGTPDGGLGAGEIFEFSLSGKFTSLYGFYGGSCGGGYTELLQSTNGEFYGTDACNPSGAVFSLDMGLGPFVTLVRRAGKVGATAQILGQGLTGATGATFNGMAATSFSVVSDTYMTAVVPSGATTGPVVATTPTGTLTSNANFRVIK